MTLKNTILTAASGLSANKSRSGLTILGIVIGISAIMLMMSIGRGAENLILGEISGFGAETIVIRPGKEPEGPSDFSDTLFADSLKTRDVEALLRKENVPTLVSLMPAVIVPGSVSYENETYRPQIFGGSAEFFSKSFSILPEEGMLFSESDIRQRASVAVLGSKVKRELFGDGNLDVVGRNITIKGRKFRVVGVFQERGQAAFINFDDVVIIPYSTAQTYLLGIDYYHEIIVKAESPDVVPRTVRDVEETLRSTHNIIDPDKDDFFVVTQQGLVDQIQSIIGALTIFLSSVVAIALVVGGVGVMNIMLVSITERTREIGLRKALGAKDGDILRQFLFEAVMLTGIGGVIGIILGALLSYAASYVLTTYAELMWSFVFPAEAALLGVLVSSLVGLVFGLYPAREASKKSPIEALRYE